MDGGAQPRGIVQRARFDVAVGISRAAGHVVEPGAAIGAKPALHGLNRADAPREHLGRSLRDAEMLACYDGGQRESGTRLPLTLGAVARVDDTRRTGDFIANCAALTSSALRQAHDDAPWSRLFAGRSTFVHVLVDFDDIALGIIKEYLVPAVHRPLAIVGIRD